MNPVISSLYWPGTKVMALLLLFGSCLCTPLKGQDSLKIRPRTCVFAEIGIAFPSAFIISLNANYIHPSQYGARFTYRKYTNTPENEPADFRRCGSRLLERTDGPLEEADYYELVFVRRLKIKNKLAVVLEAGPHYSRFHEIRYWRTNGSISTCYHFGHTVYPLLGFSSYAGLDIAFSSWIGAQVGLNGMFNSKRQILRPEISLVFGRIR